MQRVADDPAKDDDFPLSDNLKNVFNVDWKEHPFSSSISYAEETTIINGSKIGWLSTSFKRLFNLLIPITLRILLLLDKPLGR